MQSSIMVLQPDILILDEPTSQLDPIAATDFLQTLGRINRELGTTILICEHRLEDVIPLASRLLILDKGELIADDTPVGNFEILRAGKHTMLHSMPTPMRIWSTLNWKTSCPMTVSDGRNQLTDWAGEHTLEPVPERKGTDPQEKPCMELEEVWFRYEKDTPDILKSVSMKAYPGELYCILGGNGTGKSTTLSILSGVRKPYRGKRICRAKKVVALPQNPQMLLVKKNVREELLSAFPGKKLREVGEKIEEMVRLCRLEGVLDRHPFDLSGGEQQRTALAKVLLQDLEVLLLDEPTKGVDNDFKLTFAQIMKELTAKGVCVIMVSHDVEFCACYADRCGLFFDGGIVTQDAPQPFFAGKSFYTTSANRMARHLLPNAVTADDVILACGGSVPEVEQPQRPEKIDINPPEERKPEKLPKWRKCLGILTGSFFGGLLLYTSLALDLSKLYQGGDFIRHYGWLYGLMFLSFGIFAASISRKSSVREQKFMKGKLSKRTKVTILCSLFMIPLTIWAELQWNGGRKYMIISFAIIFETMLPFFLIFEGRKPQARELVILSGVAFGAEAGFMVGSMTMCCSNVLFGQGPWTPWQMFAMGVMGLLAGILFRKGLLHRERFSLSVFGGLVTFLIYGGIMNPASVFMYQQDVNLKMLLTAYITGVPADAVHALATGLFLWFLAEPMLEKLDRVKVKYGLLEKE